MFTIIQGLLVPVLTVLFAIQLFNRRNGEEFIMLIGSIGIVLLFIIYSIVDSTEFVSLIRLVFTSYIVVTIQYSRSKHDKFGEK